MSNMYAPTHPAEEYRTQYGTDIRHHWKNAPAGAHSQTFWSHNSDLEFRVLCPICLPKVREALAEANR